VSVAAIKIKSASMKNKIVTTDVLVLRWYFNINIEPPKLFQQRGENCSTRLPAAGGGVDIP
jgi:hypothetical protein